MIIGIFVWRKNLKTNDNGTKQIKPKKLNIKQILLLIILTIVSSFIVGYLLTLIDSKQAYIDASTNIIAIIAQLLMIKRYREQWCWWLILNILCLIMWFNVSNYSMVTMYIAWIINCIYGWLNYNKLHKESL